MNRSSFRRSSRLSLREMIVFALLGVVLFESKLLLEWAPNIHLLGTLTVAYTLVYRRKALLPIGIYVVLTGVYAGFSPWWVPHLYIWTILWGAVMLLPRRMPVAVAVPLWTVLSTLHGLAYGVLYAPAQALLFGLDWKGMIAWIVAGFPFDLLHGAGNLVLSVLILPVVTLLCRLERKPLPFRKRKSSAAGKETPAADAPANDTSAEGYVPRQ